MTTTSDLDRRRLHDRMAAARAAADHVAVHGRLPWTDDLAALFGDPDALALALHDRWARRVLARVDTALELGDGSLTECVVRAHRDVDADQPGVRALLDGWPGDALVPARRSLHRSLAVAAGLAAFGDRPAVAAAVGERLVATPARGQQVSAPRAWRRLLLAATA